MFLFNYSDVIILIMLFLNVAKLNSHVLHMNFKYFIEVSDDVALFTTPFLSHVYAPSQTGKPKIN